ncbi:MAG: PilZ domain-containing protein [Deltaproteobacteria bacterium]|nr:PilZ domain-containing protein [Deltaproteobacteria bacterium]
MQEPGDRDREFFRYPARLAVRFGPDTAAGRGAMAINLDMWQLQSQLEAKALESLEAGALDDNLKPLLDILRWMDFKLDMILHHLRLQEMGVHFPLSAQTVDVSGSGFSLAQGDDLATGSRVLVQLLLPDQPTRPVYAVGEVVRSGGDPGQPAVGVNFVEIAEVDRERIVRYTFQRQRQELAQRSLARE